MPAQEVGVITQFFRISAAGFAATAIAYGPARMGFGLFVPEFRSAFSLSTSSVGFVSSLGFLGFFLGLIAAEALLMRRGPRLPVLVGLGAATAGMATVALAPGVPVLALGVFLAMSSAGFAWTPFNEAVHRTVEDARHPAALSAVSTGTAVGIALAGAAALVTAVSGLSWRMCWAGFAVAAGVAALGNLRALRGIGAQRGEGLRRMGRQVLRRAALPLYAVAFCYGTNAAVFVSFAPDRLGGAGVFPGVPVGVAPAVVFLCYGVFGLVGLLTDRVKAALGLPILLRLLMASGAASLLLPVVARGDWGGLALAGGLQGVHVMMTSAVLAFWSDRLFPDLPSFSFTAALLATAAGSVLGPAVAGMVSDALGPEAMFLGVAGLSAAMALALRGRYVRERALEGVFA